MDKKKNLKRRNINNTYGRSPIRGKVKEEETKRDLLIFQACVSSIIVVIAIAIATIDTGFTNSLQYRLKEAISTQVSVDAIKNMGEAGIDNVEKIGNEAEGFLRRIGIKKKAEDTDKKQSTDDGIETNNKTSDKNKAGDSSKTSDTNKTKTIDDTVKNQIPPEAILPEV